MAPYWKSRMRRLATLPVVLILLSGCSLGGWRPSTTYLESPYAPSTADATAPVRIACLNLDEVQKEIEATGSYQDLPWLIYEPRNPSRSDAATHAGHVKSLMDVFKAVLERPPFKDVACPAGQLTGDPDVLIGKLLAQAAADHQGLKLKRLVMPDASEATKVLRELRKTIFVSSLGEKQTISASYEQPVSLAMSARTVEGVAAPSSALSRLPERAQAAMLSFVSKFADNWKDKAPSKAMEELLASVSPKDEDFSESQRTELTVSAALNTSSVDDRLDYVAAYVIIPPIPGSLSAGVRVEEQFLKRVRAFVMAHRPDDRKARIPGDVGRALGRLIVRITDIEKPQTIVDRLDLGSLQSTLGLSLEVGGAVPAGPTLKAGSKLEETRIDKLLKEIDRRSMWVTPDRTMVRVTQRGHEAITVAGTVTQNISLQVPRTDLLRLRVKVEEKPKVGSASEVSQASISVSNIANPLYSVVDGFGLMVSTVRVAVPTTYAFAKEPDGYAMTVVEGPVRLRVWERRLGFEELSVKELFPGLSGDRKDLGDLLVVLKIPGASSIVSFDSSQQKATFLSELGKLVGLQRIRFEGAPPNEVWLKVVSCAKLKPREWQREVTKRHLSPDDLLLGVEDFAGAHRGFMPDVEFKPEPLGCRQ